MNVFQGNGEKVEDDYVGRKGAVYEDGLDRWYSFRLPRNANTVPVDNDGPMTYNLDMHADAIGMTGWRYDTRTSFFCGYDFDSVIGHSASHRGKLSDDELDEVRRKACELPFVTVRRSTSGRGLHLYVFLDGVPTENHTQHAALSRAILGHMSALVGFDFKAKVDAHGGILWQWARKMKNTDGLTLVKKGGVLAEIPPDWRDHLDVVTNRRKGTLPRALGTDPRSDRDRLFDEMAGTQQNVPLDADHRKLLDFLRERGAPWTWNSDHHMLVTHTYWLKEAHTALALKGPFETVSTGRNKTTDINCYAYPLKDGAWVVRCYGRGVAEAATWGEDQGGWTRCYLNRDPDHGASGRPGFSLIIPLRIATLRNGEI